MLGEMIQVPGTPVTNAYLVKPDGAPKGAIIVIHEVWGLVEHTKDIANRLAAEGYLALAPDLLSDSGVDLAALSGLQEGLFDPERRNKVQPQLRKLMTPLEYPEFGATTLKRLQSVFNYLYDMPEAGQKVALMGFCFGGTFSYNFAVVEPRLIAVMPFYGHADQSVEMLKHISCPVQAFYGQNDQPLIAGLDDLREKMQAAGVDYTANVYPDCGHAFFNDTNRFAYNAAAAQDAWQKVLALLDHVTA